MVLMVSILNATPIVLIGGVLVGVGLFVIARSPSRPREKRPGDTWESLDAPRQSKVFWLAYLGRRADDPETAALVVKVIREREWHRFGQRVAIVGVITFLCGLIGIGLLALSGQEVRNMPELVRGWALFTVTYPVVLALPSAMCLRALKRNEPIARTPDSTR